MSCWSENKIDKKSTFLRYYVLKDYVNAYVYVHSNSLETHFGKLYWNQYKEVWTFGFNYYKEHKY